RRRPAGLDRAGARLGRDHRCCLRYGLQGRKRPMHPDRAPRGSRQADLVVLRRLLPRRLLGAAGRGRADRRPRRTHGRARDPLRRGGAGLALDLERWTALAGGARAGAASGPVDSPSMGDAPPVPAHRALAAPPPGRPHVGVLPGLPLGAREHRDPPGGASEWAVRASLDALVTDPTSFWAYYPPLAHEMAERRPHPGHEALARLE